MNNEILNTGRGLIMFNEDLSAGGYIRTDGNEIKVRGRYKDGVVSVGSADGTVVLQYRKVDQPTEKHPVARGTLIVDGVAEAISVFHAKTPEGRTVHGLTQSSLPAAADAPF